ncbi:MAG: DUF4382 domain-containing protein [Prochlorothrix sp.]|nr:DUF4382 domain-containing protein [Prochlorothrix sp.]
MFQTAIPTRSIGFLGLIGLLLSAGCQVRNELDTPAPSPASNTPQGEGSLQIQANGEDFVRQGFTTVDGWELSFDQVNATFGSIAAYQTDPPFDATGDADPQIQQQVSISEPITVDLAADTPGNGEIDASPIVLATLTAPAGHYNALAWSLVRPADTPTAYPLVLQGQAQQADRQIPFTLQLEQELRFLCGDYVGDDRKGFVQPDQTGSVEMTLHFDHLFGDAALPAEDELNQGALGFGPIAAIAATRAPDSPDSPDSIVVTESQLRSKLSPTDLTKLDEILRNLGHVGEGHCRSL